MTDVSEPWSSGNLKYGPYDGKAEHHQVCDKELGSVQPTDDSRPGQRQWRQQSDFADHLLTHV